MVTTLSQCSVFSHLFKAKKFVDEDAVLDLVDPYLDGIILFQRQHQGCPGISWPTITGGVRPAALAPVAPKHRPAVVNAVGAEAEIKQPSIEDLVAQVNALNGALAKMGQGGGAAAKPVKLVPECTHCGGRHDISACWFKHVKKPRGGGFAVVTPDERERTRVARGLPPKAERSRAGSPHPRPRAADDSDSEVNSDACLPPSAPLPRAHVGQRAQRRARARDRRTADIQAFASQLVEAGVLPQPDPPPSPASIKRRLRRSNTLPISRAEKAARVAEVAAASAEEAAAAAAASTAGANRTALSWLRLSAGGAFTDACALLDTGTSHNFVRPAIAERLIAAGAQTRIVPRSIRAGGFLVGDSAREVLILLTRERDGVQQASREWRITFDAGYDVIVGLPSLESWGWVRFQGVRCPDISHHIKAAQVAAIIASRELTCLRKSRAVRAANVMWDALPCAVFLPRPLAAVTDGHLAAARQDFKAAQAAAAVALAADWRRRSPPPVGCLRGSRANDTDDRRLLPSPLEQPSSLSAAAASSELPPFFSSSNDKPKQTRRVRFVILETRLSEQRASAALAKRAQRYLRSGATVVPVGTRLLRVVAARPLISRRAGTKQQCTIFSLDSPRSNFQHKEDMARAEGDDVRADFYHRLDKLCRRWGFFDEKRIFSKDLTLPSKMNPMRIRLIGGAHRMPMRLAMRRHSQPQKDEVRKQLITMLRQLVVERAGPDAWMSCVHLVRKPDAPPCTTGGASAEGPAPSPPLSDVATLNALQALGLELKIP